MLIVDQGTNNPLLFANRLRVSDIHWINGVSKEIEGKLAKGLSCKAKNRYRQTDQKCSVIKKRQGYQITFSDPQRAVTPGQFIVLYQENLCLGGGVIEETWNV